MQFLISIKVLLFVSNCAVFAIENKVTRANCDSSLDLVYVCDKNAQESPVANVNILKSKLENDEEPLPLSDSESTTAQIQLSRKKRSPNDDLNISADNPLGSAVPNIESAQPIGGVNENDMLAFPDNFQSNFPLGSPQEDPFPLGAPLETPGAELPFQSQPVDGSLPIGLLNSDWSPENGNFNENQGPILPNIQDISENTEEKVSQTTVTGDNKPKIDEINVASDASGIEKVSETVQNDLNTENKSQIEEIVTKEPESPTKIEETALKIEESNTKIEENTPKSKQTAESALNIIENAPKPKENPTENVSETSTANILKISDSSKGEKSYQKNTEKQISEAESTSTPESASHSENAPEIDEEISSDPKQELPISNENSVQNNHIDDSIVECNSNATETLATRPKTDFVSITYRNCQFSQLSSTSFMLSAFANLQIFNISHIGLEKLDPIQGAPQLQSILASHNNLTEIPAELFPDSLVHLDFSANRINRIDPLAFRNLSNLEDLNLSWNNLTTIEPPTFASAVKLKVFDLSHNQIAVLKTETFAGFVELKVLNLSNNLIEHLNVSTFNVLTHLEHLDLSNMKLSELESDIFSDLHQLISLNLANNNFKRLNFNLLLPALEQLQMFYVDGNQLDTLDGFQHSLSPKLHIFSINDNQFNCSYLRTFLNSIENKTMEFTRANLIQHNTNIRGISCIDKTRAHETKTDCVGSKFWSVLENIEIVLASMKLSLALIFVGILTMIIFIIIIRYKINKAQGRIAEYELRGVFDSYRKNTKASC